MSLESATYVGDLVKTNPTGTDPKSQGDDHLRLIKAVLQNQFGSATNGSVAVPGVIESKAGGIKFPDASVQASAGITQAAADARYVNASGDSMTGNLVTSGSFNASPGDFRGASITPSGTLELAGTSPFIDFKTTDVDNDFRIIESGDKSALSFQNALGQGFALLGNGVLSASMGILGFSYGGSEASGWINFPSWLGGYQFRFGSAVVTTNAGGGGYIGYAAPFSSQSGVPVINYGDNGWLDNPIAPIQSQQDAGGFGFQAIGGANITIRVNYFSIGR
jgi:hypothetical protein